MLWVKLIVAIQLVLPTCFSIVIVRTSIVRSHTIRITHNVCGILSNIRIRSMSSSSSHTRIVVMGRSSVTRITRIGEIIIHKEEYNNNASITVELCIQEEEEEKWKR